MGRAGRTLMATLESARVAVLSRGLASAAALGFNTPPARETLTGPVVVDVAVVDVGGGVAVTWGAVDVASAGEEDAAGLPLPPNVNN